MTRILVVEDDPVIQRLLGVTLRKQGYEIVSAADGEAALLTLDSTPPDLILLDMRLPTMNGWEFLEAYSSQPVQVPVIVVTATFLDPTIYTLPNVVDCLIKPFAIEALINCVQQHLAYS